MATKNKTANKKSSKMIVKHWPLLMIVLTPLLLIVMTGYLVYLSIIVHNLRDSPASLSQAIVSAVNGLHRDIPIDAKTGDAYIHEANLRLPASEETQNFVYSYIANIQDLGEEITFAYTPLIQEASGAVLGSDNVETALARTERLQACSRGFKVVFNENAETAGTKLFMKTLADGRVIHVYQEEKCSDNRDVLVEVIRTLDSY